MVTAVTPVAIVEATPAAAARTPAAPPVPQPAASPESEPSLRLVIEEAGSGQFVYKTLDRVTGETIRQIPREEMVRIAQDPAYQPGDVIQTDV